MIARQHFSGLTIMLLLVLPASACLWDEDTLMMERERFNSKKQIPLVIKIVRW